MRDARLVQCIQIWCNRVPSGQCATDSMGRLVEDSRLKLSIYTYNIYYITVKTLTILKLLHGLLLYKTSVFIKKSEKYYK